MRGATVCAMSWETHDRGSRFWGGPYDPYYVEVWISQALVVERDGSGSLVSKSYLQVTILPYPTLPLSVPSAGRLTVLASILLVRHPFFFRSAHRCQFPVVGHTPRILSKDLKCPCWRRGCREASHICTQAAKSTVREKS